MEEKVYSSLKRAWLYQLLCEHEDICWRYNVKLSRPVMELSSSRKVWGEWVNHSGILRISCRLIENYPWDIVQYVLRHEMAHQLVSEVFLDQDVHGPLFQKACDLLGVPGFFRTSRGDLAEAYLSHSEKSFQPESLKYLNKVKKLLALAQSGNEYEALLAMEKANAFMEKYNLEHMTDQGEGRFVYAIINHRRKRLERHHGGICRILNDFFYVETIFSSLYDAGDDTSYKTIELLGTKENVEIAEYVYHFLLHHLDLLWKEHRKKTGCSGREKRSFYGGILFGFRKKLEAQEEERQGELHSLALARGETVGAMIISRDRDLADFYKARFPRIYKKKRGRVAFYEGSWDAGVDAGEKLTLHNGLEKREGSGCFGGYLDA